MTADSRDRLFALLPAAHRRRDLETGGALRDLLRVVAEQVQVVEDDIAQLYENWFVETADDWVVPYIGALIGYEPVAEAGVAGRTTSARSLARDASSSPAGMWPTPSAIAGTRAPWPSSRRSRPTWPGGRPGRWSSPGSSAGRRR